jgi:hypothetical protein
VDASELMIMVRGERRQATPIEGALAAAQVEARSEDRATALAEADKQAAAGSRLEARQFAESQFGQPTAELRRCQAALGEADEKIAELRGQLEKAESRRSGYLENVRFWAERSQLVADAVTATVPVRLDPFEQAQQRAQIALDDARRAGRVTLDRARAQVAGRRRPSFRSSAATAPAHLGDDGCCLYSTGDGMPHDLCWPSQPYADRKRSDAVLAEFARCGGASRSSAGRHVSVR